MKTLAAVLLAGGLLFVGCSKKEASTAKAPDDNSSGNPITAPVDYLGAVAKAKHYSEKAIDTASITHAIQLFYAQEDRFPKDLNELAAKHYIGSVPATPTGMRWDYNPKTGDLKAVRQP